MKLLKKLLSAVLCALIISSTAVNVNAIGLLNPVKGDADMNGRISVNDARIVLRAAVGLHKPPSFRKTFYDMDGDGKITAADARKILRTAVGLKDPVKETKEEKTNRLIKAISKDELSGHMNSLCSIGSRSVLFPKNNKKAADYIVSEIKKLGYDPKYQNFTYNGIATQNITLNIGKTDGQGKILLLSAHYDCYDGSAGAIDNASGVAALLHILKIIKENKISFNCEVRVAFFSAEEMGYHGAYHYLSKLSAAEKNRLRVFNVDMAGHSKLGGGKLIAVSTDSAYGSNAKPNEISKAVDNAKSFLGDLGEDGYYSPVAAGIHDLIPFKKLGIPVITLSWREIRPAGSLGSDFGLASPSQIHTASDSLRNFDTASLYNTTKLILASLILSFTE